MTIITSLQNPRVKAIVALRDRRKREQAGVMLVEGYEELSLALAGGAKPLELYICPAIFRDPAQRSLIELAQHGGAEVTEVDERVFAKIAYRENPDGWLATFTAQRRTLDSLELGQNPFLIVCEGVEKPGNLGAILRTADAAGVDALISCDPHTDWANPNVIRASKGALFTVQTAEAQGAATLGWLHQHHIAIIAATPAAEALHYETDLRGPVAIAVGTEKQGLSETWLKAADHAVKIPMMGQVNSLNVATATALLIYEVVRQRLNNKKEI
jgi:TrmH family RNA methyltransferase